MILKSDSTRTGEIKMQLSKEYQNNFFPHGVADIEQLYASSLVLTQEGLDISAKERSNQGNQSGPLAIKPMFIRC
jgi:hypothetical protein